MADDPTKPTVLDVETSGACPCGGKWQIGITMLPGETIPSRVLGHTMQPCQKFLDLDAADFLRWIKATREAKRPRA